MSLYITIYFNRFYLPIKKKREAMDQFLSMHRDLHELQMVVPRDQKHLNKTKWITKEFFYFFLLGYRFLDRKSVV